MPNHLDPKEDVPPVCDYEGSDYRTRFWEGQGRGYEDQVERIALRAFMPATGDTLIDIGAGFGRLADEYAGYQRIVLFDYSRSLLREAQAHLGDDPRFLYVAGNWYEMPFVANLFQTLVQVRTIHHAVDVPALFSELSRIAQPSSNYILEFANKRNLKAILRHAIGKQSWSPHTHEPIEFVELNFDFHPDWMQAQLEQVGFHVKQKRTVSYFRLGLLKKLIPTPFLVNLDKITQKTASLGLFSPSVFTLCQSNKPGSIAESNHFFACPTCKTPLPSPKNNQLTCPCGKIWRVENNLYDFKEPVT